jgi:hypothetical protein
MAKAVAGQSDGGADGARARPSAGYENVFGVPNPATNAWGMLKREQGKWRRQSRAGSDGTHVKEWALPMLTPALIQEWWGPGEYQAQWLTHDPDNSDPARRWVSQGNGLRFGLSPPPQPEPAPVPAGPPPYSQSPESALGPGFQQALAFMDVIERRASGQLTGMAQFAQIMLGQQRQQTDPALTELLRNQAAQIARLEARLDAEPYDDEPPANGVATTAATAAVRAAPRFRRGVPMGEQLREAFVGFAVENPDKVVEIVKAIPAVLSKLGELAKPPAPAPAPRPRAVAIRVAPEPQAPPPMPPPPEPAPPPRRMPSGPGLNAFASSQPKSTPPPPAGPS